jgi:hypothetical protein
VDRGTDSGDNGCCFASIANAQKINTTTYALLLYYYYYYVSIHKLVMKHRPLLTLGAFAEQLRNVIRPFASNSDFRGVLHGGFLLKSVDHIQVCCKSEKAGTLRVDKCTFMVISRCM